ncbi:MAG: type IV toxin-antitoxin system AbiEi family antitoxin domain-containing protein [Candidatus Brocadiia bacterium]
MNKSDVITKLFKVNKGFARTSDILKTGVHPRDIKTMLDKGQITRVKRGIYRSAEIDIISHQGFIDLKRAAPGGVICLLSALAYFELTTFNPSVISMALSRGMRRPKVIYPPVEFYYFSARQFDAGIREIKIGSDKVRIYCPEKTICDCFRYRNKLGLDTVKEGLAEYLKRHDRNLEELLKYAQICRVKPLVQTWLNVMV